MAKAICERGCSTFYFTKDTFDGVPIPIRRHLESVAIFIKNSSKIVRSIDEKDSLIEPAVSVKLVEKPPRRLFRRRRKQAHVGDFVRCRIDGAIQLVLVTVEADHLLVDRDLILCHRRDWL
jgi:hypothetical protein